MIKSLVLIFIIYSAAIAVGSKYNIDVEIETNPEKFKIFPNIGKWNIAYLDAGGCTILQVNKNVKRKNDSVPIIFKDTKKMIFRNFFQKSFRNKGGLIKDCADPCFLLHNGVYYLYVTAEKFVKTGIPVYKSTDLVNWEGPCGADNGLALSAENVWGDKWFFAGAVIEKKGKFYMFPTVDEHLVVATSDSPLGPFKQKIKKPMHNFCEIDSGIFTDDDGKTYIFFVRFDRGNVVFGAELNDDFLTMKEETITECLRPDQPWEFGQNKPLAPINEGAFMLKHKGIYYLTYSGAHYLSKDYAISYATSKNPLGPWKKYKNNPILKANDFVSGTGNGEFIKSPDGSELFCVYHTHKNLKNSLPRALAIDRAYFKKNPEGGPDILVIDGPTIDEQPMPK